VNALRPGWQTSEFWIALVNQLLALLVLVGLLAPADRDQLGPALGNAVVAAFTLLGSAAVVWKYIHARTALKQAQLPGPQQTRTPAPTPGVPALVVALVLLGLCLLPGTVAAQCVPGCPCPSTQPATLLPWRRQIEQQLQQRQQQPPPASQTDPAVLALLQQLVRQNEQILALLANQQQRQVTPPIIVLGPGSQIPFGGPPPQQIPLGPPPRQDIPLGPPPKQDVPLGGPPKQDVPPGGPPKQDIPLGTPPRPESPVNPPMPRATGWQRYQQSR
jgi:hypothetical protein